MLYSFIRKLVFDAVVYLISAIGLIILLMWALSVVLLIGPVGALEHWLTDGGSAWPFWGLYGVPLPIIGSIWFYVEYVKYCRENK